MYVSRRYLRHAAAGIQFGLFVLVGVLIGSYLDRRAAGSGLITFIGLIFGLICGTYFLIKDFLFKDSKNGDSENGE
jgi:F0F1-type ATP synthase assembly protein I